MLPITPQVFDGIEFGSIGRQALKLQPAVGANQELFYQCAPMRRRTIPDHKQVPFDMGQQVFQKDNHLWTSDGSRKQLKVEVPPRYAGTRRERFPIEVILDNRRLSPWLPSPASVGTFTESALVNKDYCSSLSFSVFLTVATVAFSSGGSFLHRAQLPDQQDAGNSSQAASAPTRHVLWYIGCQTLAQ